MKTIPIAIFALVTLMLSTSTVYFAAAYEEANEEGSDEENKMILDNEENEGLEIKRDEKTKLSEMHFSH